MEIPGGTRKDGNGDPRGGPIRMEMAIPGGTPIRMEMAIPGGPPIRLEMAIPGFLQNPRCPRNYQQKGHQDAKIRRFRSEFRREDLVFPPQS